MKKNWIYIIIIIICVSVGIGWYFSPMQLHYLISKEIQIAEVEEIRLDILTTYLQNTYEMKDKPNIDEIINIFDNVKVRRVISPPVTYRPALGKTYFFILTSKNKAVPVYLEDKDYLSIMRHTYKIVNGPDIKKIDELINSL
jgi:hypothetical protein